MRRKSFYSIGIFLLALAMLFVSCNSEMKGTNDSADLVDVKLAIVNNVKALNTDSTYTAGMAVSSYEYKASCSSTPGAPGTQTTWAALDVDAGSASLSGFARGTWTIEVRAKNANNGVFAQGTTGAFELNSTSASSLTVVLNGNVTAYYAGNSPANVTVSVGVTVPTLSTGSVVVRYVTMADIANLNASGTGGTSVSMSSSANYSTAISGATITHNTASAGNTAYYGSASLAPGLYVMQVLYKDGNSVIAGQTMAFRVIERAPFAINGTLTAGEVIDLTFESIAINDGFITVEWDDEPWGDIETALTASVTTSSTTGALTGTTYKWYLDGVLVAGQTTASFTTTNAITTVGSHTLTCIVTGTIGGVNSSVGYITGDVEIDEPETLSASSEWTSNPEGALDGYVYRTLTISHQRESGTVNNTYRIGICEDDVYSHVNDGPDPRIHNLDNLPGTLTFIEITGGAYRSAMYTYTERGKTTSSFNLLTWGGGSIN